MMYSDFIHLTDSGRIRLSSKGRDVFERIWHEPSVIETKGWVRWALRERGKLKKKGEGCNIWTNTGREFLAMLMTYQANGTTPYRNDRMGFIGIGTGMQTEDPNVAGLVTPISYDGVNFLAPLDHSGSSFPLDPTRTTIRYVRVFAENEISTGADPVLIGELGLFTDGEQSTFAQGGRNRTLAAAALQSPAAYKSLTEPVEKTNALEFQVEWEIRH
jgi:hypothetical protein